MSGKSTKGIGGARFVITPTIGGELYGDIRAMADRADVSMNAVTKLALEIGMNRLYALEGAGGEKWEGMQVELKDRCMMPKNRVKR